MEQAQNGRRLAVLVGCNYPDTRNELHGCYNDVLAMKELLKSERFGFEEDNIEIMTDKHGSSNMPTGVNIKKALSKMIDQAKPGDVLIFHYSGHGTLIDLNKSGHLYKKKKEEAIVPTDFNMITNLDFRNLVNRLPKGATFTIISDSCHSGGLIDKEKEQIGPSSDNNTTPEDVLSQKKKSKNIQFETVLEHLSSLTNINTQDMGTHLLEIFGADASIRFREPNLEDAFKPLKEDEGILLSGCQANETSADIEEDGGKRSYGAFSNAIQIVLKENPGPLSNRELVIKARNILNKQHIEQHPCLYCSDENANSTFLSQA
ncbi:hypothetical protein LIER_01561 [Lithospermum erythrorhizon]|uniref:Peptidase C14 caspase domain-containing protein n=1 Tax=Lithospermum erythrorhizon TaxID=34254 RepID=A0AAV3NLG0_LITER